MPVLRDRFLVAVTACAVSWFSVTIASSTTPPSTPAIASSIPPPVASASTCPSRTINFITETLPQQCLRTDWSSNATTSAQVQDEGTITTGEVYRTRDGSESNAKSSTESSTALNQEGSASAIIVEESAPAPRQSLEEPITASSETFAASKTSHEVGEQEDDPLSDAANFVSFEEWKAKMLEKAGQSPENIGGERKGGDGEGRPPPIHQALDSFEDDGEIELDFAGFVDPDTVASALPSAKIIPPEEPPDTEPDAVAAGASTRSKNAGTTSKDRTNYASLDCAAQVLKTNSECKGANSILLENKDNYMLNPCSAKNKFFIVELCNDILIDTIALANYEFFSSTFRQVRFSISDQYPVKLDKWRELGVFEAQNRRGVQAFLIENGLIWGRYLRLEFLGHYGSEYYCPVSLLRVHGKTMMDDYRNDFKNSKGDDDMEADTQADALKVIQHQQVGSEGAAVPNKNGQDDITNSKTAIVVEDHHSESEKVMPPFLPNTNVPKVAAFPPQNCRGPGSFNDTCPRTNYFSSLLEQVDLLTSNCHKTSRFCNLELTKKIQVASRARPRDQPTPTPPPVSRFSNGEVSRTSSIATQTPENSISASTINSDPKQSKHSEKTDVQSSPPPEAVTPRTQAAQSDPRANTNASSGSSSIESATVNSSTQASIRTPVQQVPAATPSTQESFFKSVHKRLQLLEANSTLSLQYIEEQSRLLREAFTKVEKRQLSKTTSFLASLNETVLSELREFRTQYDQIWQSTILELSSQREQTLKEAGALSVRLAILADEVVWQKRLVYLQFGLILLCLAFFVFAQGSTGSDGPNYLELPMLRDMLTRSPYASRHGRMRPRANTGVSLRSDDRGPLESPVSSPSRPVSRSGLTWARSPARSDDEATDESVSKVRDAEDQSIYRLPTPPSEDDMKSDGLLQVPPLQTASDPEPEVMLRRAISSPTLGKDEAEQVDEEGEPATPIEPPRVAELARDADRSPASDVPSTGIMILAPTFTNGDNVL